MNFPEDSATNPPADQLQKGDTVTVVGASQRRGHLIVENNGTSFHVPFQFMELVKSTSLESSSSPASASAANAIAVPSTSTATTNLI